MERYFDIARGTGQNGKPVAFLQLTEDQPDEYGNITRKRGFTPIVPELADKALQAAVDGKTNFVLGAPDKRQKGLYEMIKLEVAAVPATQVAAQTGK